LEQVQVIFRQAFPEMAGYADRYGAFRKGDTACGPSEGVALSSWQAAPNRKARCARRFGLQAHVRGNHKSIRLEKKTMNLTPIRHCVVLLTILSSSIAWSEESVSIEHKVVAVEKDRFHGWPANNGVWRWDNEILVAFTQGDFVFRRGHNIGGRQDTLLARSLDGGETWQMFDPEGFLDDDHNETFQGEGKTPISEPMDFSHPGFALRYSRRVTMATTIPREDSFILTTAALPGTDRIRSPA
jgi:hypothetical protein